MVWHVAPSCWNHYLSRIINFKPYKVWNHTMLFNPIDNNGIFIFEEVRFTQSPDPKIRTNSISLRMYRKFFKRLWIFASSNSIILFIDNIGKMKICLDAKTFVLENLPLTCWFSRNPIYERPMVCMFLWF